MAIVRKYGWIKDKPDSRDLIYPIDRDVKIPQKVDLRPSCSDVEDQADLGSCTANALAGALEFLEVKNKTAFVDVSRLYIYYNERRADGDVYEDAGSTIRTGAKVLAQYGACNEKMWPYDTTRFTIKPTAACYTDGAKHRISSYTRITSFNGILQCLATGYPIAFGFDVYTCMETEEVAKTGMLPMPGPDDYMVGGHAVLFVGYDQGKKLFIVRNSWGASWGDKGYFYMPFDYVDQGLASDFWTIKK